MTVKPRNLVTLLLALGFVASACSSGKGSASPSGSGGSLGTCDNGACSDGGNQPADGGPGGFTFPADPLSTFMSESKALKIELRTAPDQPIHVGPGSAGQLTITDASTGAPVDGLDISVATWMPVMRHSCSPVPVKVVAMGQGSYLLTQVTASMKGACQFKLTFSGSMSDKADSPTFDITQ